MSPQSEAVFLTVLEDYRLAVMVTPGADPARLTAAAEGHIGASRPYAEVAAEYTQANSTATDPGWTQELAQELSAIRMAQAVLDGNLPYRPPIVSTGG